MDFRNEVFKYKPMKMMLLFWINYHLCTVLDEVPPGPLKDVDVMDSRVRFPCKMRQNHLCKIMHWKFFQKNKYVFTILLIESSIYSFLHTFYYNV